MKYDGPATPCRYANEAVNSDRRRKPSLETSGWCSSQVQRTGLKWPVEVTQAKWEQQRQERWSGTGGQVSKRPPTTSAAPQAKWWCSPGQRLTEVNDARPSNRPRVIFWHTNPELDYGSGQSKKNKIAKNGSSSSGSVSTKLPVSSIRTC